MITVIIRILLLLLMMMVDEKDTREKRKRETRKRERASTGKEKERRRDETQKKRERETKKKTKISQTAISPPLWSKFIYFFPRLTALISLHTSDFPTIYNPEIERRKLRVRSERVKPRNKRHKLI